MSLGGYSSYIQMFLNNLALYKFTLNIQYFFTVSDDTQDAAHEEEQTARVKEWINSRHISTVDLADVLSNFPDISMVIKKCF